MTLIPCSLLLQDSQHFSHFPFTSVQWSDNCNAADSTQASKPKLYVSKSGFVVNLRRAASLLWTCLPPFAPVPGSWSSATAVGPAVTQLWIPGCMCAAGLPALSPNGHSMPQKAQLQRRIQEDTRNLWNNPQLSLLQSHQFTTQAISRLLSPGLNPHPKGTICSSHCIDTDSTIHSYVQAHGTFPPSEAGGVPATPSKSRSCWQLINTKDCAGTRMHPLGDSWELWQTSPRNKHQLHQIQSWRAFRSYIKVMLVLSKQPD